LSLAPAICDSSGVNDPFQQAVAETLPVLKNIRSGFGVQPTASAAALERLRSLPARESLPASEGLYVRSPLAPLSEPEPAVPPRPAPSPARREEAAQKDDVETWTLDTLREAALACVKCPHLVRSRTQVVFGVGNPNAELMFVGEAPGADEDEQGEPFVGKAGQLLTKIIQAMGFTREEVYIGNVLKCRPDMPPGSTGNRKPRPEEMKTCLPWLEKQIELIQPRAMVALGATAIEGLLGNTDPVGRLRGRWLDFKGIPVMTTYHPAYLLRNQSNTEKRKVWEDMLKVLEKLGKPISEKQRQYFTKSV
jgi:uracil-DNA glycosylase family 4